jgi:serine/threonine protein kinase
MAVEQDPNALKIGSTIAGYEILRVIGSGGFGITYEAASRVTGKHVAIKEFFPRGIASREESTRIVFAARDMDLVEWALKRFESSTADQCKLKHPNIVDVIHYVKDNDTGYMIMEYVEGETLEHWLRQRAAPPSMDELKPLLEPIFDALDYLHAQKLIHRDIAPDNIMIRADGRPTIIDFGAIKMIEQETQIRSKTNRSFTISKQFYSPPEQVQDHTQKLDARADVYATAATMYRALAGRPPASAEERTQQIAFGNGDPKQPLGRLAPHLPAAFAAAIDRALAFNARDRTASIETLRGDLGWGDPQSSAATLALARGESASAPGFATVANSAPSPAMPLAPKQASAWRWAAPVIVAATLAGAVFLAGGHALNLFGARGPALIVQQPPPVLTRQPQQAEPQVQPQVQPTKPEPQQRIAPPTPAQQPPAATRTETPPPDPQALVRADFEIAQKIDSREAYEQFLKRYPEGFYAELARAQLKRLADAETLDVTVKLNAELRRLGCGPIGNDGVWGDDSRKALTAFNRHAATKFEVSAPSADALAALRAKTSRVCPLVCGPGQRAAGETCVAACAPGFVQAQSGACVRPQQPSQPPPAARNQQPAAPKGKLVCRYGDFTKGEQPHRQVCEMQ